MLLCGLCCAAVARCLFMSAGVPSGTTWPPAPSPMAPQEPTAVRSQAVSSDSGAWGLTWACLCRGQWGRAAHRCH